MNTSPSKVNEFVNKMDVAGREKKPFHSRFNKWNQGSMTSLDGLPYIPPPIKANIKFGTEGN